MIKDPEKRVLILIGLMLVLVGLGINHFMVPLLGHISQVINYSEEIDLDQLDGLGDHWTIPKDLNPQDPLLQAGLNIRIERFSTTKKQNKAKGTELLTYEMRVIGEFRDLMMFHYAIDTSRANLTIRKAAYERDEKGGSPISNLTLISLKITEPQ